MLLAGLLLAIPCWAQSTRTWQQTKYDEFEKGTTHGVAISSDGSLTLAPSNGVACVNQSSRAGRPQGNETLWSLGSQATGSFSMSMTW